MTLKNLLNVSNVCNNKFLKNRNGDNETEYKNYKKLFKLLKNVLKRITFPN